MVVLETTVKRSCGHVEAWPKLCKTCEDLLVGSACDECRTDVFVLKPCGECDAALFVEQVGVSNDTIDEILKEEREARGEE